MQFHWSNEALTMQLNLGTCAIEVTNIQLHVNVWSSRWSDIGTRYNYKLLVRSIPVFIDRLIMIHIAYKFVKKRYMFIIDRIRKEHNFLTNLTCFENHKIFSKFFYITHLNVFLDLMIGWLGRKLQPGQDILQISYTLLFTAN